MCVWCACGVCVHACVHVCVCVCVWCVCLCGVCVCVCVCVCGVHACVHVYVDTYKLWPSIYLQVWDIETAFCLQQFNFQKNYRVAAMAMVSSPHPAICTATADGTLRLGSC